MALVGKCPKCGRWVTLLASKKLRNHHGASRGKLFCEEINWRGLRENRMPENGSVEEMDQKEINRRNYPFLKKTTSSPNYLR